MQLHSQATTHPAKHGFRVLQEIEEKNEAAPPDVANPTPIEQAFWEIAAITG